ncbi:MAG: 16S rRNA (cytosine(967)-C(5))-methyltransferase RsmB, partial [Oscillospiraceae bacterium]|nr:16S rRNA (cytosine(967)-C(5))-methyltransferase RsmB [Oscillospiraceae bacterium]
MTNTARRAALDVLERCRVDKAWSSAALDSSIKAYGLDRRDSALASRICLGVMQNEGYCDYYIDRFCLQGADRLQPKLRNILRIGVY